MLFNSLDFALFLPIVFFIYWIIPGERWRIRNLVILASSYVFYGWWDPRFLILIILSTITDYTAAQFIEREIGPKKRKIYLWTSIAINLGVLAYFKYSNFFLDQLDGAFSLLGHPLNIDRLDIILPVGISFYTFQTMSYTIDVYRRIIHAEKDIVGFAAYVSFFPQLVAGPIERAASLLPQFRSPRIFEYEQAADGTKQIIWGFFKKLVIADNCAPIVEKIFADHDAFSGGTLVLGIVLFSMQVYGDFSGYSDIAVGTARLFGFRLMRNFAYPYFSRDIAEFWRRWHISLSTWFRDYVYIPLGGSRGDRARTIRNIFIMFLVSGFWHGPSWNYVLWGGLHALFFLPLLLSNKNRRHIGIVAEHRNFPTLIELGQMLGTFFLFNLALIIFRSRDLEQAWDYITRILSYEVLSVPEIGDPTILGLCTFLIIIEWLGRRGEYGIETLGRSKPLLVRWSFLAGIIVLIGMFMDPLETPFIYFQF